nr:hypothetical protein [Streptomyces fulvoviolaceus]
MAMELDDPGFHHSVLADLRSRLAEDDRAGRLLDLALARLKEAGLVRERTTQRTDSTHVLAAVHVREAIARHGRGVEVNRCHHVHIRQQGLLVLLVLICITDLPRCLPSCTDNWKITQPGTLFDLHVPRSVEIRLLTLLADGQPAGLDRD